MTVVKFKYQSNEVTKKAIRDLFQNLTSGISFKSNADEIEICFREQVELKIIDILLKHNPVEVVCDEVTPIISVPVTKKAATADEGQKSQHQTRHLSATKAGSIKFDIKKHLDTIAAESFSFEDFAEKVSKSMQAGSKDQEEVLKISIRFAADSESINLRQISTRMCRSYSTLTCLGSKLSKKIGTTLLELLKKTTTYKEYPFKEDKESVGKTEKPEPLPEPSPESSDEAGDLVAEEEATTEAKENAEEPSQSQMSQDLDSILKQVDKNNPVISDRIEFVLEKMGLKTVYPKEENRFEISEAVCNAVTMKDISWRKAVNDGQDADVVKMQLSTLINDFCERTKSEPMKAKEFIQKLQKEIMWESEINI